ncbi:MAG: hypothetical protein QOJ99_6090 [Bryobacterales bacterium]|nr:hypothetical protein [Bryobacterales bacterium]
MRCCKRKSAGDNIAFSGGLMNSDVDVREGVTERAKKGQEFLRSGGVFAVLRNVVKYALWREEPIHSGLTPLIPDLVEPLVKD